MVGHSVGLLDYVPGGWLGTERMTWLSHLQYLFAPVSIDKDADNESSTLKHQSSIFLVRFPWPLSPRRPGLWKYEIWEWSLLYNVHCIIVYRYCTTGRVYWKIIFPI
jgi:hypothetical protein